AAEIAESTARHGMRPMQRLWDLGLLTPALNAVHMGQATAADIELAQRGGIAITLCPQANLKSGLGLPPARSFTASGIRLALGSGAAQQNQDIWSEMKLLALMSHACNVDGARLSAWDALAVATRGGAEVLGLEAGVGSLAAGKWADLCCVDLGGPATQPMGDPVTQLVFGGGRDLVSDVWVAGRHLLSDGEMTRLDWAGVAARANAWAARLQTGG
ncbi:MAG TPA: amidohydrolase family protein, partial [Steroidobacteraceae bacterium]